MTSIGLLYYGLKETFVFGLKGTCIWSQGDFCIWPQGDFPPNVPPDTH